MTMTIQNLVFASLGGITVLAALGVVLSKNMVHSALFLVLTFLGVGGIYFNLGAGFLALVQILVYAGAISVLMIFAIMLVMKGEAGGSNPPGPSLGSRLWGIYLAVLLTLGLGASIWFSQWAPGQAAPPGDKVKGLAGLMLGNYVVAFEMAAILLLLAVVGAIILAKGDEK
ncbi:MAG TPA: NADH-quinone oxidoreductase subunit J [Syntrophomonadaceae bacterium]|nr:NADH-quinone oxidoreductase subunit J [Syntrophomonadaceae bacterium]